MNETELHHQVRTKVSQLTWYEKHGYELLKIGLRAILYAFGLLIFYKGSTLFQVLSIPIMGYAFLSLAISGTHEAKHNSIVESRLGNQILGYLLADMLTGQSSEWWEKRHVKIHHQHTNVRGKDDPMYIFPWMNKYIYFFVLPYAIFFWLVSNSIKHHYEHSGLLKYIVLSTSGYLLQSALFLGITSLPTALLLTLVVRSFYAPLFMHLAIFNHVGLAFPTRVENWTSHQLLTTRNIKKNWFLSGLGGNAFLEAHTEHHLYPTLSNSTLEHVIEPLKKFAKDERLPYHESTYFETLRICLREYDRLMVQANHE